MYKFGNGEKFQSLCNVTLLYVIETVEVGVERKIETEVVPNKSKKCYAETSNQASVNKSVN